MSRNNGLKRAQRARNATSTCPVSPVDYRHFKAACSLLGLEAWQGFARATQVWLAAECPAIHAELVRERKGKEAA